MAEAALAEPLFEKALRCNAISSRTGLKLISVFFSSLGLSLLVAPNRDHWPVIALAMTPAVRVHSSKHIAMALPRLQSSSPGFSDSSVVRFGSVDSLLPRLPIPGAAIHSIPGSSVRLGNPAIRPAASVGEKSALAPGDLVLVVGAVGGVGQLVTAKLLEKGYRVRAVVRDTALASEVLGTNERLEVVRGDTRMESTLPDLFKGVQAVVCATGTTAFPSKRWGPNDANNPEQTDYVGVSRLVDATPKDCRFVLVSSVGVERYSQPSPYFILNLFGVLKWKEKGEQYLKSSGLEYTIFRPGRLTDGPYTSYDLNTLLNKVNSGLGVAGERQDVELKTGDCLDGEMSRITLAEAVVQSLQLEASVKDQTFCCSSIKGAGPGQDAQKWDEKFRRAASEGAAV
eukprot:gnl/TRDRNA2_/TRDRNA2_202437_c0_seq1.p1 gnl/TRDRNA2_/TRDRNA2_202437_c0~~gnl/TRDRNA2_/TRDRNA2_202437_c0_seq1.p1  ORF type:complete len:412 (-),score=36.46 gnl/TRDRNA2_/TRDRNA2_202437_c0_seq1:133-1329(-)